MLLALVAVLAMLLVGCAGTEEAAGESSGEVALQVTGSVDSPADWTEDEVKAMDAITVQSTNKDGETSDYTGVLISDLLEEAGVSAGATTLVFVAGDGYTAEMAVEDALSCSDCILSFRNQGGFSSVLPGQSGGLQVKDVVELQVK